MQQVKIRGRYEARKFTHRTIWRLVKCLTNGWLRNVGDYKTLYGARCAAKHDAREQALRRQR